MDLELVMTFDDLLPSARYDTKYVFRFCMFNILSHRVPPHIAKIKAINDDTKSLALLLNFCNFHNFSYSTYRQLLTILHD